MTRRSPQQLFNQKRSQEGGDFELYTVPAALETDGYQANFSHRSHGPYDHAAWKPGQLLVIAARLTGVDITGTARANPSFSSTEINNLWNLARDNTTPGMQILPIIATSTHAPTVDKHGDRGPCRCSHTPADHIDPVRYLQLTGPAVGRGQRPNWKAWTPNYGMAELVTV